MTHTVCVCTHMATLATEYMIDELVRVESDLAGIRFNLQGCLSPDEARRDTLEQFGHWNVCFEYSDVDSVLEHMNKELAENVRQSFDDLMERYTRQLEWMRRARPKALSLCEKGRSIEEIWRSLAH